jgi:exo-1,4-beta-D-glucosaminidase
LTRSSDRGEKVLPIFWDDNYFSLLPKEKKELKATFKVEDLDGAVPVIEVEGWTIKHKIFR